MRKFRYKASGPNVPEFEIVIRALGRDHAADLASQIGFKCHLYLVGPK